MAHSKKQKSSKPRPSHTFRSGPVRAAVWQNVGDNGPFYSAVLTRSFRDAAGNWRTSTTFGRAPARRSDGRRRAGTAMDGRPSVAAKELTILNRRPRFIRGRLERSELWQPIESWYSTVVAYPVEL